jgi:Protein of unknown function (DUF3237)
MSENLTAALPEFLKAVNTRHLFSMRLDVKPSVVIGQTPNGFKRAGIVTGGIFDGDRLTGIVLDGGTDWQLVRPDNSVMLDVRLNLKTTEGDLISLAYKGIRTGAPEILKRVDAGEVVDPSTYYFRMTATFETASSKYSWLNSIIAIGVGSRGAAGPTYSLFELL